MAHKWNVFESFWITYLSYSDALIMVPFLAAITANHAIFIWTLANTVHWDLSSKRVSLLLDHWGWQSCLRLLLGLLALGSGCASCLIAWASVFWCSSTSSWRFGSSWDLFAGSSFGVLGVLVATGWVLLGWRPSCVDLRVFLLVCFALIIHACQCFLRVYKFVNVKLLSKNII